jgi:hypothetical protein
MSKLVIRLSALAAGASALLLVTAATPAEARKAGAHTQMAKHRWHGVHHVRRGWPVGEARPVVGYYNNQPGPICPAVGHSFDCKIWPPPYEDDPDRKVSKH